MPCSVVSRPVGLVLAALCVLIVVGSVSGAVATAHEGWPPEYPEAVKDADFLDDGAPDETKVELGRLLFFDKILSGNRNISCASCHHPLAGTADGLSLPVGEGGAGLAATRDTGGESSPVMERVPRNAPAVFNLGAREFETMFHDGRVQANPDHPSGFDSPAGDDLPAGLDSALAVQAMFPVTSATEMAGQPGENAVADAAAASDLKGVWNLLADRLAGIDGYATRFVSVFEDISAPEQITYAHAANAIAAFEAAAWRFDNSPFDRHLRGDHRAMSQSQKRGMGLFYRRGGCSDCHSGKFQTDHRFHALAVPQLGPGKGDGPGYEDYGRERVTANPADRYRFRTPPLRNVAVTGPWGHDGAFKTLRAAVEHHLDALASLATWDRTQVTLPSRTDLDAVDFLAMDDPLVIEALAEACEIEAVWLTRAQIDDLMDFLAIGLTDPAVHQMGTVDIPPRVPSGLPIFD